MANFEVQFSVPTFLKAQLRQLQSRKICLPPPEAFNDVISIQVQRILFGTNNIRHNAEDEFTVFQANPRKNPEPPYFTALDEKATGFKTQIAQDINVEFALTQDIMTHPNQSAPIVYTINITAIITFSYYPGSAGSCVINRYLEDIEWKTIPPLPPGLPISTDILKQRIHKVVATTISGPATPFDFTNLLPTGVSEIANAGVSVDIDNQRIVFRADPAPGNDYNSIRWTNFYRGNIPDHLQGADWSMFLDDKVLETMFTTLIEKALKKKSIPAFRVSSVGSQYQNHGGIPRVTTILHTFVDYHFGEYYLPLPITTDFSYDAPTRSIVLNIQMKEIEKLIDAIKDFLDTLKDLVPPLWLMIDWISGNKLNQLSGPIQNVDGFTSEKISDFHYRFTHKIEIPSLSDMKLQAQNLIALSDGVAITGKLQSKPFTPSELALDVGEFSWNAPWFGCSQLSESILDRAKENPLSVAYLYTEVTLEVTGTTPIYFCSAKVLNDKLKVFPTEAPGFIVDRELLPCKLKISMGHPPQSYLEAPYDFEVRLETTAGIRLIKIPRPSVITESEKNKIVSMIKLNFIYCTREIPKWFDGIGRFDVNWIEDPLIDPPLEIIDAQILTFSIQGLRVGQTTTLVDTGSQAFIHATSSGTTLTFSALVPSQRNITLFRDAPSEILRPLGIRNTNLYATVGEAAKGKASKSLCTIDVWYQPLLRAAYLNLNSTCQSMLPATMFGNATVVVVMRDVVMLFDLANPFYPQRIGIWSAPGVKGVLQSRNGLLIFGEHGFSTVASNLIQTKLDTCCEAYPISDVVSTDQFSYVLTDSTLDIRTSNLCPIKSLSIEGGRSLHLSENLLWVGGSAGIEVFSVSEPRNPRLLSRYNKLNISHLSSSGYHSSSVTALLTDGSQHTFALIDNRISLVNHSSRPWFPQALVVDQCLVRLTEDHQGLAISTFGQRRAVVNEQNNEMPQDYQAAEASDEGKI